MGPLMPTPKRHRNRTNPQTVIPASEPEPRPPGGPLAPTPKRQRPRTNHVVTRQPKMLLRAPKCHPERPIVIPSEAEESEPPVSSNAVIDESAGPLFTTRRFSTASSNDKVLRFLGCARNHYGLAKAAQGDENAVLPAGWELYMSSVPSPAPRPQGYRLSPVRRCGGCPGYFRTNDSQGGGNTHAPAWLTVRT